MKNRTVNEVYRKDPQPKHTDPYLAEQQYPEPTRCPECGCCYLKGMWWNAADTAEVAADQYVHETICPACRRIADHNPAGYLTVGRGGFLLTHADEIENLINNQADQARSEHPLQRIMDWDRNDDGWVITTTSDHLAVRLGKALHRAYKGDLDISYAEDEKRSRVDWRREA